MKNGEMLIGEYTTSITSGKRVAIPKQLRAQLGQGQVVLTRGYEGCVVLVSKKSFEGLLVGVSDAPFISADKRETARFLLGGAHEMEPDGQGRVVLPESLVAHAELTGQEVVFVGVGNWVEIWGRTRWEKYKQQLDGQASEIAGRLVNSSQQTANS